MAIEPHDDGLYIGEVGPWAKDKYYFLGRYLEAFTIAMREKWAGKLHFVDLFAGPGFHRIRNTDTLIAGSSVIAANVRYPFRQIHCCDNDVRVADALKQRLALGQLDNEPRVLTGDVNELVDELLSPIAGRGALGVTFADPYGLHLDFDTIRKVANKKSDLIILLADNMDALRNWRAYSEEGSALDRFLGKPGLAGEIFESVPAAKQAERLRTEYIRQLRTLGYEHFAFERIRNTKGRDIYILLFASRDKAGLRIWQNLSQTEGGGQRRFAFD